MLTELLIKIDKREKVVGSVGIITDCKIDKEYPHFYERLVSDDVFERNQEIKKSRNRTVRRGR